MSLLVHILLLAFGVALARNCTKEDWLSQYTECSLTENKRDLIYYKNPDTDECSGGEAMPSSIFGLSCDVTCKPGYRLPRGAQECEACPAGQYTLGGGIVVTKWDNVSHSSVLPFRTYATDLYGALVTDPGTGWYTDPGRIYLRSGKIKDAQNSILEVTVHLVTKGKISFRYLVDSEDIYDGMSFSINGKEYIEKVGNVQNLETFTQELDRGYYTFQWKYSKDYSFSYGADAAYIQRLEILGTQYADENCVKCDAGTYNNASGTGECYRCPRNTYAAEDGATACEACPAGTFSTIGASECLARRACTLDDVTFHYTPCELRDGAPVRDLVYEWPESTDCDYTSEEAKKLLPAAQHGLPCGDCNPGTARSTTTGACEYCGADMASDGRVGSVCAACPTGTHPAYGLYFNQWSESSVLDAFVTNCTGQCNAAGAGWEIANTSIMSGSGNGLTYVTTLEISFNATEDTTITFSYSIHINDKDTVECVLAYNEVGGESHVLYMPYLEPIANTTYRLSAGHHHIRFVFSSVTKNATAQNYARIYSIAIPYAVLTHGPLAGVVGGSECVPCAQGSFSTGGKAECALCAPGYSSDEGASECSLCPENTFNDVAGGICRSCGNAVSTPAGSEQCPLDCVYSPDNNKTLYDIRSLFKNDMYGPVYDGTGFQYFINICSQKHSNVSCIDEDGKSIDALACQVLNNCPAEVTCTGKNLGMVAGYYPLDASQGTQGFVLEYTGGDPGCDGMFRSVNVTFLCTPDAGVGFPAKPDDKEEIEGPGCHYDFTWRSLYGCPVCTERDYSYYYTECKDNKRRKVYFWNENPRACHDGVALPADEIVPTNCSTQTICAEGKYVDGLTGACVDCPEGTYSVGPGSRYESFTEVPAAFTNRCGGDSSCLPFRARNGHLISGYGAESVLRYTATFVMEGSVSFDYSLYLPSPADAVQHDVRPGFEFSVDGVALLSLSNASIYGCAQFTHDLTAGGHVLEWRFTGADSRRTDSEDFAAVELHSIVIRGDKYSPLSCTPCPAGYFQASTGAAACTPCPTGTVVASPTAATKCVACGADEYSFDGVACQKRPECTAADWEAIYGPCIAGKASRAYVKLAPTVCTGGSYVPPSTANETVDCPPCPPGTARKGGDGECVGCSNGLVAQEKNGTWTCVETAKGHAAVYSSVFFGENDTAMAELPQGWETSGLGWRVRTGYVDSGVVPVASTPMKSFLTYKTEIVVPQGSVSFDVACSVPRDRNIFLFVNNQRFPLSFLDEDYYGFYSTNTNTNTNNNEEEEDPKWTPFTVPVERGPLELTWVSYYARADTVSASVPKFRLRNVRITGVAAGGESASQQCPAGTEASAAKTACEPCPAGSMSSTPGGVCEECYPGTFSNTPGAVACDICYAGTSSELPRGSTRCVTACVFSVGPTETYNLTLLGLEAQGPLHSADGSRVYLSVCSGKFPEGVCGSSANTSSSGFHVCRVASDGVAYDNYGTNLKFVPSGVQNHFALDFLDGAKTVPGGVPRSTRINFACNVNIGTGYPILEFANESHLEFSWVSYIACRNCVKETDYERVVGKCKNSKAKVELVKKGECYGPSVISEADEKCKDVVVPIVVPVVSGIILVLLVVVIALVIYRNRVITTKYENLRLANPLLADEGGLMEDISESKDSSIVN